MACHAGGRDSAVRVDGLEVLLLAAGDDAGDRPFGLTPERIECFAFKICGRGITLIDRPLPDEPVANSISPFCDEST